MRSVGRPISLATKLEASHTLSVRSASQPEPETRNGDMSDRPTFPFPDIAHMYYHKEQSIVHFTFLKLPSLEKAVKNFKQLRSALVSIKVLFAKKKSLKELLLLFIHQVGLH